LIVAFEVPNAVANVAVAAPGYKTEEIGKLQVPVKPLVQNPYHK